MNPPLLSRLLLAGLAAALAGCSSVNHLAVNKLGDALASGGMAYASDNDPDLIRDAAPFSLKLMESLLAENPRHAGLLLAASNGFTQYSYAFVQQEADAVELHDVAAATALRARARGLYLRGRDYGLRGLELNQPMLRADLHRNPRAALRAFRPADVPLLFWTGASWAAAIAVTKDDPALIAELPIAEALVDRALELDEAYDYGQIHAFLINYEMSRPGGASDAAARSLRHLERATQLNRGGQAGPLVAFAESVCVQQQDRARFESLLRQALAIDANEHPEWRLVNLVMQRRARWLLGRIDDLFLPPEIPTSR